MTPKSLLRHRLASSPLDEVVNGRFQRIIGEIETLDPEKVKRVVFCSGKVFYDLLEARRAEGIDNVAIIRVEQLYPFPVQEYAEALAAYPQARDVVWCQEEPQNQGAWYQIQHRLRQPLQDGQELYYAGRQHAAAPAAGIFQLHVKRQQALVEAALRIED